MNEGMIERLKEAIKSNEFLKLTFIYPKTRPIFLKGYVRKVMEDSFIFEDRYDGEEVFGFEFLQGIKSEKKNETKKL